MSPSKCPAAHQSFLLAVIARVDRPMRQARYAGVCPTDVANEPSEPGAFDEDPHAVRHGFMMERDETGFVVVAVPPSYSGS